MTGSIALGKSGGELLHLSPESRILINAEDCDPASLSPLSSEVTGDPAFQVTGDDSSDEIITFTSGQSELHPRLLPQRQRLPLRIRRPDK